MRSDDRGERAAEADPDADGDGNQTDGDAAAPKLIGEELAVGYPGTDEPVVECEKLVVPRGEVTALVGPNGSGKSTLLRALSNRLDPEGGRIVLDGAEIQTLGSKELARRLGVLSQENESPGGITVEDLAYHGRYPHRGFFESVGEADRRAVDRALELTGIEELRDRPVDGLSGGQRQLAWIAMTLAQETDVLLLDEPTTFLDLRHQLRVMEVIRELNRERGVTVAVVLHDVEQAARFADNLVALRDGTPYDWGPPADVVTEELLADVFGVHATVLDRDPPRILAHRPAGEPVGGSVDGPS